MSAVAYTVTPSVKATRDLKRFQQPWDDICAALTNPQERESKGACRLMQLATFGETPNATGSLRHAANLEAIYGLVGDYDAGHVCVTDAAARLTLAGVEAFIYTTASHTAAAPRWRVLAPLSTPVAPQQHRALMDRLNAALEGILAPESWKPAQVFYFGRVAGVEYETARVEGACIDTLAIDVPAPEPAPIAQIAPTADVADVRALLDNIDPGTLKRDPWLALVAAIHSATGGSVDGLALAIEWSRRGDNFKDDRDVSDAWRAVEGATLELLRRFQQRASAEDFDDLTEAEPKGNRFRVQQPDEFMTRPKPAWHIPGVLPKVALGAIYGATGVGKTFWALDICAAIARGAPWRGIATQKGVVVYIAAEDDYGVAQRMRAYRDRYGECPVLAIGDAPNLTVATDTTALIEALTPHKPAIVVIDTLPAATAGAAENESADLGTAFANARAIHKATGATVLLITHPGKVAARGMRGWSGQLPALDVCYAIEADVEEPDLGDVRTVRCVKMKNAPKPARLGFYMATAGASCVVEHCEPPGRIERVSLYDDLFEQFAGDREGFIKAARHEGKSPSAARSAWIARAGVGGPPTPTPTPTP